MLNPLLLTLGSVLGEDFDWKDLIQQKGEAYTKAELRKLLLRKVEPKLESMGVQMVKDGFIWVNAANPAWLRKKRIKIRTAEIAYGPGFVLSRDALYRIIRTAGIKPGLAIDVWRDAADNGVFEGISPVIDPSTSADSIMSKTFEVWLNKTVGD